MPNIGEKVSDLKIKSWTEIEQELEKERAQGHIIVHCHGVFDLIHPGHIRHFKEAKALGQCLVVTLTPDRFVNKGPGRPVFTETLRLETLAALAAIDYVVLNDSPDAVTAIRKIRPHYYVKGIEYKNHGADVTGKVFDESRAVEETGGQVYYTDDIVFSSSSLLNHYFHSMSPEVTQFLSRLKEHHSNDDVMQKIEALSMMKVLVIGDAILDEYQYIEPLGQSGKGVHMVARCHDKEVFLGGSLVIANHIAEFVRHVTLLTALGQECPYRNFIHQTLSPKVHPEVALLDETTTLTKKRYVIKDGKTISKLFETYSGPEQPLRENQTNSFIRFLREHATNYDLVLVCDFGNGFTNPSLIEAIANVPTFLALNTQANSGNRGFNIVTHYRRADYISLNEPELRLAAHDKTSALDGIAVDISHIMHSPTICATRGIQGVFCYQAPNTFINIPPFAMNSVDRVGAGDSFFSLSALCFAKGYSPMLSAFIGSVAAAMSVQVIGNQESVKKIPLCKFITRLLK